MYFFQELPPSFTSHYVSINSLNTIVASDYLYTLHPTMYLLILNVTKIRHERMKTLHPTMYLLILKQFYQYQRKQKSLHPTMYLLILRMLPVQMNIYNSLHPTMYLLIRDDLYSAYGYPLFFTSHYVSINSKYFLRLIGLTSFFTSHYVSINS